MFKAYIDFNCPFSFALHEYLSKQAIYEHVQWCYVEHNPSINIESDNQKLLQNLTADIKKLNGQGQNLNINNPDFCSNTRLAILSMLMVEQNYPTKAAKYRYLLFSAYWQHNLDISQYEILCSILVGLELKWCDYDNKTEELQLYYQKQWQQADFGMHLPVLVNKQEKVQLGLQATPLIDDFLAGETATYEKFNSACNYSGEYSLAILNAEELAKTISTQSVGFKTFNYKNVSDFITNNSLDHVDAVLINFASESAHRNEQVSSLNELCKEKLGFPIFCILDKKDPSQETLAFHLGANDVLLSQEHPLAMAAKIKKRIANYKAIDVLGEHAHIDGMTGLMNKPTFKENLQREWRIASRTQAPISLIILDFDFFKLYNDHFGHCAGDECLKRLATTIKEHIYRPSDIAARFGGEEFILLFPDTSIDDAMIVAERIRTAVIDENIPHPDSAVATHVTISLGLATVDSAAQLSNANELIELADQALYRAKETGRNKVSPFVYVSGQDF